jgi:hypothetical protein
VGEQKQKRAQIKVRLEPRRRGVWISLVADPLEQQRERREGLVEQVRVGVEGGESEEMGNQQYESVGGRGIMGGAVTGIR